jgi:hypothetical protein
VFFSRIFNLWSKTHFFPSIYIFLFFFFFNKIKKKSGHLTTNLILALKITDFSQKTPILAHFTPFLAYFAPKNGQISAHFY